MVSTAIGQWFQVAVGNRSQRLHLYDFCGHEISHCHVSAPRMSSSSLTRIASCISSRAGHVNSGLLNLLAMTNTLRPCSSAAFACLDNHGDFVERRHGFVALRKAQTVPLRSQTFISQDRHLADQQKVFGDAPFGAPFRVNFKRHGYGMIGS